MYGRKKYALTALQKYRGRFCTNCGQENLEPRESAWHIIRHTLEDITHFDGKFFTTIKNLLTKPGFLSAEYMNGRRARHLNPVRMYLFTSAIFFIIISSLASHVVENPRVTFIRDSIEMNKPETEQGIGFYSLPIEGMTVTGLTLPAMYAVNGVHVYDSMQNTYASRHKDRPVERFIFRRIAAAATAYHKNPKEFMDKLGDRIFHSFSKVVFLSLPLFALFLQLLYIRNKRFYFTAHAVFSLHFYCALFLLMLVFFIPWYLAGKQSSVAVQKIFDYVGIAINIGMLVYLYVATQRFYGQVWYKTTIKFILQTLFFIGIFTTLTLILFLNSMLSLAAGGH